jgi:PAS domain S-box-containing protein
MPADAAPGLEAHDLLRLLGAAPGCFLVLTPDFTIVAASDAYLRATMTTREGLVGRPLFQVFPDNPDDPKANGAQNLRASLLRVLERKETDAIPVQKYDIRRPEEAGGGFEERVWKPVSVPVLNERGEVTHIIHHVEDVTAEQRSETRFAQLLNAAPDAMVVVGEDGKIALVNLQTEKVFGYTREELIGQPLSLLVPERFRQAHPSHERRYFQNPSARPMGSGIELAGRHRNGTEIPIEVSLSPLHTPTGVTVSAAIRDITDRKRLEADAKTTAARLTSAVDSIQDAFALFDNDDRLVLCNSAYRRLIGNLTSGPLVGRTYESLLEVWLGDIAFPDDEAREKFRAERMMRRQNDHMSAFDIRLRDGRSLRVVDRRTAEGGLVKTIWDLTDHERRAEELREARAAAEAGSAAKTEFLASMSHELRTPLNAILGFAQLLQRDKLEPLSERHKERVQQILRGGEHLLHLIDDILDLSRIEAGGIAVSIEPVPLVDVLNEVTQTLETMAARHKIIVEQGELPSELPMISADRTRFLQILMNFGSNAIKYNRPGGKLTFTVARPSSSMVRVAVKDTGLGIPADKHSRLFQPFQRAGQETGPIEGTGIGLVITRRLARLMNGEVGFHSVEGQGSEFWVDIPVHVSGGPASDRPHSMKVRRSHFVGSGRRVLLYVEDNPANVAFMRDLMSTFDDVDLIAAPNAEMGIELARARLPEVVIMDINLPGMSGIDALRALRTHAETANIPVIALSAAASDRDRARGTEAGFFRYLTKPVKVDEFVSALDALLSQPR